MKKADRAMQQTHTVTTPDSPHRRSTGIPAPLKSNGVKKVYPRDSVRLFKSDLLESFTHIHPVVPLLIWAPVIGVLLYRAVTVDFVSPLMMALVAVLGLLVWTLTEYTLHRFVFHYPATSAFGKRIVYILHGLHHEDPVDPTRLVMPPLPAIIYATLLFIIFRALIGPTYVEAFMAFFMMGYLAYDYTHYYVHFFNPTTTVGKFLKRYHMQHHFADYEAKWGVSNPLWDYVFGTVDSKMESKNVK